VLCGYHHLGLPVRRFFSNFAGGWPALGLLLIRIAAGVALIIDGKSRVLPGQPILPLIVGVLAIADGSILLVGLWTPLAGILAIALSAAEILVYHENPCPGILVAAMGAGVAFVGPGALSIDARLFGLKKIDIDKLEKPPHN
jgi:putative oxidoreductase